MEENKKMLGEMRRRITEARMDRTRRAPLVNEVLRLAMPHRRRIGDETERTLTDDDIADLLDGTMAEAVEDFASDMMADFTPPHEPWVDVRPTVALKREQQKQIADELKQTIDWFWEDLSQSSFYDAAYECYHDLAAGTMAIMRKDYGPDQPVAWEPVQPAALLLEHGPNCSVDGRWYEYKMERRLWEAHYGRRIPLPAKRRDAKPETKLKIVDGTHRVWEQRGQAAYRRVIMVDDEIVYEKILKGDGAIALVAARWRSDGGSAYGVGAAWKGAPAQRVLNEITALTLASLHKVVDPPVAYSDDGTANIEENGVDAGDWVNLGENFDVKILESGGKFDVSFFMQDDLRRMVRRALYQDKPEQRGKTPPTASQWTDERMESQQRFEVPRGKLYREWTVPIVRSHMWLRQQQGVMPEVALDGRVLKLEPISGQARARAFEKVQKAERLLGSAAQFMPQEAQLVVDGAATLANIKEQLGDELVRIRTPDEIAQLQQAAMQMAQQQQQPEAA